MRVHSGRSGPIRDIANIQNARSFRISRAPDSVVLNITNARSFRTPPIHPEWTCIQDAQSGGRTRIQDIQDGPGPERVLTGYPESALTTILNILNGRPFMIFGISRIGHGKRSIPGFDNPDEGGKSTLKNRERERDLAMLFRLGVKWKSRKKSGGA